MDETTREQLQLELETLLRPSGTDSLQIDGRFCEGGGGAEEGPREGPRCLSCHLYPLLLISCCWYGSDKLRGPAKNELQDDTRPADQPLQAFPHRQERKPGRDEWIRHPAQSGQLEKKKNVQPC